MNTDLRDGFCPHCGARVDPNARFCASCGEELITSWARGARDGDLVDDAWAVDAEGRLFDEPFYESRGDDLTDRADITDVASGWARVGAYLATNAIPGFLGFIPVLGIVISWGILIWQWFMYRRGRDLGTIVIGLRIVRHNGELSGFYHTWTRGIAAIISAIPLGAGYWTAFFDPDKQTWHDKMMGTYVVRDRPEYERVLGTSSQTAKVVFWISVAFFIVMLIILILAFGYLLGDFDAG